MSDTSQGPGWWQASDGKWYTPEQAPGYELQSQDPGAAVEYASPQPSSIAAAAPVPPPQAYAATQYPGPPQSPKTNGMAIASLVLGILWFAGVGAVLAVIFGFVGRKKIEESQGRQTGGGLAIAGIVLGIVGVVGAIGFWILIFAVGAAVDSGGSYANGYSYGTSQYSSGSDESNVCNSSNVPSGDVTSSWISGCHDGWNLQQSTSGQ